MGTGKNLVDSLLGSPWFHGNRAGGILQKFDEFGRSYISKDLGTAMNYGKPYGFLVDPKIPILDLGDKASVKNVGKELFRDHYAGSADVSPDLDETIKRAIDEGGNPRLGLEKITNEIANPDLNTESIWDDPAFARWFGEKFSDKYPGIVDGNGVNAIILDPSYLNRGGGLLKSLGLMTAGAGAAAYAMSPDDAQAMYIGPKGLANLFAPDQANAILTDAEKMAAKGVDNEAIRQATNREWAKEAGNNTQNMAQALSPGDLYSPSPQSLVATAALVSALKSKDQPLEDTYQPADLLTAFLTGGGGLMSRGIQAALDPVASAAFDYIPRVVDAINPRNIVMGLMR